MSGWILISPAGNFSASDLQELADSILEVGLIHPRLSALSMGMKRFMNWSRASGATAHAGWRTESDSGSHPHGSELLSAEQALVEYISAFDLNPLEISKALKSLLDDFGLSQEELAQRIGKKSVDSRELPAASRLTARDTREHRIGKDLDGPREGHFIAEGVRKSKGFSTTWSCVTTSLWGRPSRPHSALIKKASKKSSSMSTGILF